MALLLPPPAHYAALDMHQAARHAAIHGAPVCLSVCGKWGREREIQDGMSVCCGATWTRRSGCD